MCVSANIFLQKELYPGNKLIIEFKLMFYSRRLSFHSITTKSQNTPPYIFITMLFTLLTVNYSALKQISILHIFR